jgi:two-component sensor histidine kinase
MPFRRRPSVRHAERLPHSSGQDAPIAAYFPDALHVRDRSLSTDEPALPAAPSAPTLPTRWLVRIRNRSVFFYLLALVLGTTLPILAFVSILFLELQHDYSDALNRQAQADAVSLAGAVGSELHDMQVTLNILATSPELSASDLEGFHGRTKAALSSSPWFLIAVREDGQQLLNTRVSYGTPLGKTVDIPDLDKSLAARKLEVSDALYGRVGEQWVFNVVLPLPSRAQGVAALILTENLADLDADANSHQSMRTGWKSAVIDGANRIVVAQGAGLSIGSQLQLPNGVLNGQQKEVDGKIVGYSRIAGTQGWRALVWGPPSFTEQPFVWSWWQLFIGGGLLLLVSAVSAALVGRSIHRSIVGIADMAVRLGRGEPVIVPQLALSEADTVAQAILKASRQRGETDRQMKVLLRELAHRTKNLMTVVQGIIRQTGRHTSDIAEFRRLLGQRLDGLSQSIGLLTASEWSGVSLKRLVQNQLGIFVQDWSRVDIDGEDFILPENVVQGLGMILHELATNATKYGSLAVSGGAIQISWTVNRAAQLVTLRWRETGIAAARIGSRGFGTELIEGTAASLGGTAIAASTPDGLQWTIAIGI